MPVTLAEIVKQCSATLEGGDPSKVINAAAALEMAEADEVAPFTDTRYKELFAHTRAGAVFLKHGFEHPEPPAGTALLFTDDPEMAFLKMVALLHPALEEREGVDPKACVEPGAEVGSQVYLGPFAVVREGGRVGDGSWVMAGAHIGRGSRIGKHCRIYPHVVIYDNVELGDGVIVHSGAVLGADGFGYKFREGSHQKVPQVGTLKIGDNVEIGANTAIDRAALGCTEIQAGSKIDNLVQIGHNAKLGKHVILCGQAGLAGSVAIDDYAIIGAKAGIADHLKIGAAAMVGAGSGVHREVPAKSQVFGYPAVEVKAARRQVAALRRLPEMQQRLRDLEDRLKKLEGGGEGKTA